MKYLAAILILTGCSVTPERVSFLVDEPKPLTANELAEREIKAKSLVLFWEKCGRICDGNPGGHGSSIDTDDNNRGISCDCTTKTAQHYNAW